MKVLNVDDRADNRYMLETVFRTHGHEVDSASNGVEALRMAERGGYDVIVSDILMPGMDGFQLCREIRRNNRLRHIPLVIYTATYTDPRDAALALGLGADRFLLKPLEPQEFLRAIDEVVAERKGTQRKPAPAEEIEDETVYLKEYNSRLIQKLEKKMLDLEKAHRELEEDVAKREKLEQQLRQAQKLEAIGTLAGGIAHDFNNILAGIIGFADLAGQDAADPAAVRRDIAEVLKASERARVLVRQILVFSQRQEQERHPMQLHPVIDEALGLLRATIPKTVEIAADLDGSSPTVLADATQIHQVVTNLVTNAWQAIGDRAGRIDVVLQAFDVDADSARTHPDLRPQRYARLTISDNGSGMDAATLERIFEPFFTTKDPGRGTGLGLAVVHGIMRANDGACTVYSQPGKGTSFRLYFPALEREALIADETVAPVITGHGERILFLDDEPALAALGATFLTRLGYEPVVETDAARAIERFASENFAAVVTDLTMPQMSGLDVGRQLLQIRPDLPLILTTGYNAALNAERVRSLGFRELLLKPYNIRALAKALHEALVSAHK
jgi:CheY-like chemotaxis protein